MVHGFQDVPMPPSTQTTPPPPNAGDASGPRIGAGRLVAGVVLLALSWPLAWSDGSLRTLWPSVVALGLVLLWRRVLTGLTLGALAGCVILAGGQPVEALAILLRDLFLPIWGSTWKLGALAFTLILGGTAALIERGGGLSALLRRFMQNSTGDEKRRVQWAAYLLGLVCFFDGLANSMLVGRLMRTPAAKVGLSGPRLAYLVDSTSSAVACLAVVSTWIAYQLAMIREGFDQVGQPVDAYGLFFASIPVNYYCWFTLVLLALAIHRNLNLGPMRAAEAATPAAPLDNPSGDATPPGSIRNALIPLGVLIGSLLIGLYLSGAEQLWPLSWRGISEAFGQADAASVLVVCSLLAATVAALMMPRAIRPAERLRTFAGGAAALFAPTLVLIGAWLLGGAMQALGTAQVIAGLLGGDLPVWLLPGAVFLAGAAISFSTGTSWGTMGILMPLSIPVAFELTGGAPGALMPAVVGAVFSGAVFGDHCSPISDTTLVSSISTGVRPEVHVRTQMPYALTAAGTALLLGFLPLGLGLPGWAGLALGVTALWMLARLLDRRSRQKP